MKCPDCRRPRSKCRRFSDELARGMRADMGGTDAVIAAECIGYRDLIRAQSLRDICARELADANADRANYAKALDDAAVAVGCSEEWSNLHSHDDGCILDGIGGMKQEMDAARADLAGKQLAVDAMAGVIAEQKDAMESVRVNLTRIIAELDAAAHLHNSIGEPKVAKHLRAAWTTSTMMLAGLARPAASPAPAVPAKDATATQPESLTTDDPRPALTGSEARGANHAAAWIARAIGRLLAAQPVYLENEETRRLLGVLRQECDGWACRWSVEAGPQPVSGEVAEVLAWMDGLSSRFMALSRSELGTKAEDTAMGRLDAQIHQGGPRARAHVERLAREVTRLTAALRIEDAECATLRARVAELEAEIKHVHDALPFVSDEGGADAKVRVLVTDRNALKARVEWLERVLSEREATHPERASSAEAKVAAQLLSGELAFIPAKREP